MIPVKLLSPTDWTKFAQVRKFIYKASCSKQKIRAIPLEPTQKIHHLIHPGHPLTLVTVADDETSTCLCFACGKGLGGLAFFCESCDFIIDVECATRAAGRNSIGHGHGKMEHFSHQHSLTPCSTEDEVICCVCRKSFSGQACGCARCNIFLHGSCAEFPSKILHPYHWFHPLHLVTEPATSIMSQQLFCDVCHKNCCGITYRCDCCNFNIDIECIGGTIEFEGHNHLLSFVEKITDTTSHPQYCNACKNSLTPESSAFRCIECDIYFHLLCGPLPCTIEHESDHHPLILMDYLVEDDSGEYYCEVCEERRDPRDCVYCCAACQFIVHFHCVISKVILSLMGEHGDVELRTLVGQIPGQVIGMGTMMKEIELKKGNINADLDWGIGKDIEATMPASTLGSINFSADEKNFLKGVWALMDRESNDEGNKLASNKQKDDDGISSSALISTSSRVTPAPAFAMNGMAVSKIMKKKHNFTSRNTEVQIDSSMLSPYSMEVFTKFMQRLEHSRISSYESLIKDEDWVSEIVIVGNHGITQNLVPVFRKLLAKYGDISAKSVKSLRVRMFLFVVICRALQDMCSIRVVDIKIDMLCHWWNCFRFVQIVGFNIQPLFDHLKRVARAYHGLETRKIADYTVAKFDERINETSGKIEMLTAKLDAMKENYNQTMDLRKSSFMVKCLKEANASKWKTAVATRKGDKMSSRTVKFTDKCCCRHKDLYGSVMATAYGSLQERMQRKFSTS